jgi:hypothetical protein
VIGAGTGIILYASKYSFFHINCSSTSSSSAVYQRRESITGLPDAAINGVKRAWVQKSMLRIPLRVKPHSCCTATTGFAEN